MAGLRTGVIVLGMHRAGTSLVAGLVRELGFATTDRLVPPAEDNPKGYAEHRDVVEIHDQFLRAIGRIWSDSRPLTEEVFQGEAAKHASERIRKVMKRDFQNFPRWVLKDPRMCRLLPLWAPVLARSKTQFRFLHVVRSPDAVAQSLAARDSYGAERSYLLWLRHLLEAERFTRGKQRYWIEIERLDEDPQLAVGEVARWLDVEANSLVDHAIETAYDRALIHHRRSSDALAGKLLAHPWIQIAQEAFQTLCHDHGDDASACAELDSVWSEITRADQLHFGNPEVFMADQQRDYLIRVRSELLHLHQSVQVQREEIAAQRDEMEVSRQLVRDAAAGFGKLVESRDESIRQILATIDKHIASQAAHEMRPEFRDSLRDSTQAINGMRDEVEGLRTDLTSFVSMVEKSATVETIDERLAVLDQRLAKATDIDVLRQTADSARAADGSLNDEFRAIHELVVNQRKELSSQHKRIDALRKSIETMVNRLDEDVSTVSAVGKSVADFRNELKDVRERLSRSGTEVARQFDAMLSGVRSVTEESSELHRIVLDRSDKRQQELLDDFGDKVQRFESFQKDLQDKHVRLLESSLEVTRKIEDDRIRDRYELDSVRQEKDQLIREKNDVEVELERVGGHLAKVENDHNQAIEQLRESRREHERAAEHLSALERMLNESRQEVKDLTEVSNVLNREIDDVKRENHDLRRLIEYMTTSVSWRITGPIRWLRSLLGPTSRQSDEAGNE